MNEEITLKMSSQIFGAVEIIREKDRLFLEFNWDGQTIAEVRDEMNRYEISTRDFWRFGGDGLPFENCIYVSIDEDEAEGISFDDFARFLESIQNIEI